MRRRFVRVPPERKDTVAAAIVSGAVAAAVGAVTFYLTRVFLTREVLEPRGRVNPRETLEPGDDRPLLPGGDGDEQGGARE